jgi:hypothetical protein
MRDDETTTRRAEKESQNIETLEKLQRLTEVTPRLLKSCPIIFKEGTGFFHALTAKTRRQRLYS